MRCLISPLRIRLGLSLVREVLESLARSVCVTALTDADSFRMRVQMMRIHLSALSSSCSLVSHCVLSMHDMPP